MLPKLIPVSLTPRPWKPYQKCHSTEQPYRIDEYIVVEQGKKGGNLSYMRRSAGLYTALWGRDHSFTLILWYRDKKPTLFSEFEERDTLIGKRRPFHKLHLV